MALYSFVYLDITNNGMTQIDVPIYKHDDTFLYQIQDYIMLLVNYRTNHLS